MSFVSERGSERQMRRSVTLESPRDLYSSHTMRSHSHVSHSEHSLQRAATTGSIYSIPERYDGEEERERLCEFLRKRRFDLAHKEDFMSLDRAYDLDTEIKEFFCKIHATLPDDCRDQKLFDEYWGKNRKTEFSKENFKEALEDFSHKFKCRILIKQIVHFRELEDVYDSKRLKSWDGNPVIEIQAIHYCNRMPMRRAKSCHRFQEHSFSLLSITDGRESRIPCEVELAVGELELKFRKLLHQICLTCCGGCGCHAKFEMDRHESEYFMNTNDEPTLCETIKETYSLLKSSFKSLMWFVVCAFILGLVENQYGIEKAVEDLYEKAKDNRTYTLPYFGIILGTWLIRAANGPGISKSLITSSITILVCIFHPNASKSTVFSIVMPIDWCLDISLSFVQLAYAAPMMSASLYFLFEMFQYFVFLFHWAVFVLWAIVLAAKPNSPSQVTFWICLIIFLFVISHFIMRARHPRENPKNFFGRHFMVSDKIRGERNFLVQDYDKVIGLYINGKQGRSLVHAWAKFFHFHVSKWQGSMPFLLKTPSTGIVTRTIQERQEMSPEQCLAEISNFTYILCIIWSVLYTVVSEMVILLDAVFLLIYVWRNWHGILIIGFATAADIDRIWTIDAFYKFSKSGDLVESASQIIWWKLFKMPLAWLICYLHAVGIGKLWNLLSREPPPENRRSLLDGQDPMPPC